MKRKIFYEIFGEVNEGDNLGCSSVDELVARLEGVANDFCNDANNCCVDVDKMRSYPVYYVSIKYWAKKVKILGLSYNSTKNQVYIKKKKKHETGGFTIYDDPDPAVNTPEVLSLFDRIANKVCHDHKINRENSLVYIHTPFYPCD